MKYWILSFILGITIAGCTGKKNSVDQTTALTDSIPNTTKAGLLDSIRDPSFRKMVMRDSIEIIEVLHKNRNGYNVEFLTYIDYRVGGNLKMLDNMKSFLNSSPNTPDCHLQDTIGYVTNPYPEVQGLYITVSRYKGHIVYSDGMDFKMGPDEAVMDKVIYTFGDIGWCEHYVSAYKDKNGILQYILHNNNNSNDTLEIKSLNDNYNLQLWKWSWGDGHKYELRINAVKGLNLPTIIYMNNLGLGVFPYDTLVAPSFFDKINYDSLMSSK